MAALEMARLQLDDLSDDSSLTNSSSNSSNNNSSSNSNSSRSSSNSSSNSSSTEKDQGSQCRLLAGKTILIIGEDHKTRSRLQEAVRLGIKVVFVGSNSQPVEAVTSIVLDMTDHTQDVHHASSILQLLQERQLPLQHLEGCLSWVDDYLPLAALVGQGLGLRHTLSLEAAMDTKSKSRTLEVLAEPGQGSSGASSTAAYASPVVRVDTAAEVAEALRKVPLPAVMKPEFGCDSVGVKIVHTVEEAEQHIQLMQRTLKCDADLPGVGLGFGQSMILMPRLVGSQHFVEMVMFEGQPLGGIVCDQCPIIPSMCRETGFFMPSALPTEQQHQLVLAAVACFKQLGLETGVFSIELMITQSGIRVIEVNARMSGSYVRSCAQITKNIDMYHMVLLCACGIRPVLPTSCRMEHFQDYSKDLVEDHIASGRGFIMGILLQSSRHAEALNTTANPQRLQCLHDQGQALFFQHQPYVDPKGSVFDKPFGALGVIGSSPADVKRKLISLCTSVGLETKESHLKWML